MMAGAGLGTALGAYPSVRPADLRTREAVRGARRGPEPPPERPGGSSSLPPAGIRDHGLHVLRLALRGRMDLAIAFLEIRQQWREIAIGFTDGHGKARLIIRAR